ncbi:MAG TPA: MFS transporter [Minicystis sp.]|nr:MFS transporter [Minicystis sp.]
MSGSGDSRRLVWLFSAASFVEVVFWSQMNAFTPLHLPLLGVSGDRDVERWTGLIVAISSTVGIPFLPLWGALAERYDRKAIVVRSFVAHLVAAAVMLLARDVDTFLVGRAVMSFSLGNSGLMMATLSDRTPAERLGRAFAVLHAADAVGALVGPLLGGPIVDRAGLRALLGVDAACLAGVVVALALLYRDPRPRVSDGSVLSMAFGSLRLVTRSGRLVLLFPALLLLFAGWMLGFVYVPLVVAKLHPGADVGTWTGLVSAGGAVATVGFTTAFGRYGDRRGHARAMFVGAALAAVLWPLPAVVPGFAAFAVLWALINGVSSALFALGFIVLAQSCAPEAKNRVMTFAYVPVNLGYALGPAIGTALAERSLFAVFPASSAMTVLGMLVLAAALRRPVAASPA